MLVALQEKLFEGASAFTRYFPDTGRIVLDASIKETLGSELAVRFYETRNRNRIKNVKSFRRFLVNPDTHIGDSIMGQAMVTAIRDFFPDAEIDYVVNRSAFPLVEGNPEIDRLIPLHSGNRGLSSSDLLLVQQLVAKGNYDVCFNICPFLQRRKLSEHTRCVFDFLTHLPVLVRNEFSATEVNHFAFQYHQFIHGLLSHVATPVRKEAFVGVRTTLSDEAIERAADYVRSEAVEGPIVLLNPDTASNYTRVPFEYQAELLQSLVKKNITLCVGEGHSEAGMGQRLLDTVPTELRHKTHLVPANVPLDVYSALVDHCDFFVTGDTGPMHIAASQKHSRSGNYRFRNRTAVVSIFGATPSRMSGYDSVQPGYLTSHQDAESWTFVAESRCRNLTCVNKLFKSCKTIRCFDRLAVSEISALIGEKLQNQRHE